jgi:Protein of unknown function (DUF4013)
MKIGEIINDSIRYPLSNKRTFLFLGLIVILSGLPNIFGSVGYKGLILILGILSLILYIVRSGYQLRIMEFSTEADNTLPELNEWKDLFINGLKVILVTFVYVIPILVVIIPIAIIIAVTSVNSSGHLVAANLIKSFGLLAIIMGLYLAIIYPIYFMSLANMAKNGRNIDYAFKFNEIKNIVSNVRLGNLIIWYIFTGLIYLFILLIGFGLTTTFNFVHFKFIGVILTSLIVAPYALIFLYRSAALIYLNGTPDKTLNEIK